MDPNDKDEEKPKSQSEMFEEAKHSSFFGHLENTDEETDEKKEEEKEK